MSSPVSVPPPDTDRNLLFGVLALQAAFLDNNQFAEVCAGWVTRKQTPLADLLVERGWLTNQDRAEVERQFQRHLRRHGGDVRRSLGAVADAGVRDVVRGLDDPDLRQSLSSLPPAAGYVLVETVNPPVQQRSRYALTRLHGEGGLGRVYVAHDGDLNRDVALKEIRPDQAQHPEMWRRFLKEAQITGQLEHPNIVPVYEAARRTEDDAPFYTMRLVRGQTLREAIADYHRRRRERREDALERPRLLQAFVSVCQAVGYAHSRGVIHRDLKSENVVLGGYGEVIVLDWGLAKVVDEPEDDSEAARVTVTAEARTDATQAGRALGTPAFMAPEQAEGRLDLLDARTDVYGLGAILFEILTGRPPHEGSDTAELLRRIVHGETPRARAVEPSVSKALDAICAKAMAKARSERYARATELAEDVQRYLADEPVSVYREPLARQAARWGRQHRVLATAASVLLVSATVGLGITTLLVDQQRRETIDERDQKEDARREEEMARVAAVAAAKTAEQEKQKTQAALAQVDFELYLNQLALAERRWVAGDVEGMEAVLAQCRPDFRGWEWHYLRRLYASNQLPFRGEISTLHAVAISPDGRLVAGGGGEYDRSGQVKVWDLQSTKELFTFQGFRERVWCLAFSPDGKRLAAGTGESFKGDVKVWDLADGREVFTAAVHTRHVKDVAFSADGKRLGSASNDGTAKVLDAESGRELQTFMGHEAQLRRVALSPDGRLAASSDMHHSLKIWKVDTGEEVFSEHGGEPAFSPDGKQLAASDLVYDVATGTKVLFLNGPGGYAGRTTFRADGERLVAAAGGDLVNVWDRRKGELLYSVRGHRGDFQLADFSRDCNRLVAGSRNQVRIWDVGNRQEAHGLPDRVVSGEEFWLTLSANGRRLAVPDPDERASVMTLPLLAASTVGLLGSALGPGPFLGASALLPGRNSVIDIDVRDTSTLASLRKLKCSFFPVGLALSSDGARVAAGGMEGADGDEDGRATIQVWDTTSGKEMACYRGHAGKLPTLFRTLAFSPDGMWIASACDQRLKLWDAVTGQDVLPLQGAVGAVAALCFHPNGHLLAVATESREDATVVHEVAFWDLRTGRKAGSLRGHTELVRSLSFSPNGAWLASASDDRTVRVWPYPAADRAPLVLQGHTDAVHSVAFHPRDASRLFSGSDDKTVKIWDLKSGRTLFSLHTGDRVSYLQFGLEGHRLFMDSSVGRVWDAAPLDERPAPVPSPGGVK